MSHNVDKMFSVRQMPWHAPETVADGRTTILDDFPQTWDAARVAAGLDWEPEFAAAYGIDRSDADLRANLATALYDTTATTEDARLDKLVAAFYANLTELPGHRRVVRSDTRATLGVPRDSYALITHSAFGEIFEAVLQAAPGSLKAETGGCLEGGAKVWMLIKLDEPIMLPGDKTVTMPYLALTSRHDSYGGCNLRATAVRIVCANTFGASELEGERSGLTYQFIHRGDWRNKLEDARAAVTGARKEFAAYRDIAEHLLGIPVTPAQRERFIIDFIPAPTEGLISDRVKNNIERARKQVRDLIDGPTITGTEIENTAYGLVQAAGEYLDHIRRAHSWETKLGRSLLRPEPLKARAMTLALEAAKA